MKVYLIAIGGTGIKCVESLLFINSVSKLDINEKIEYEVFFVDSDNTGNYDDLTDSIKGYKTIKDEISRINTEGTNLNKDLCLFHNTFNDNGKWSIAEDLGANFASLCWQSDIKTEYATEEDLMRVLYEPDHVEMKFKKGFRGFPNIGTLVTKYFMNKDKNDWHDFVEKIENDNSSDSQIILLGSIFGGTGASGIPSILHELTEKELHVNKKISIAMMLPYFSLIDPPEKSEDNDKIYGITDMDINSAYALEYYRNIDEKILSRLSFVLVGQKDKDWISDYNEGSYKQNNKATISEMVAGLLVMRAIKKYDNNAEGAMYFASYDEELEEDFALSFKSIPCDDDFIEKISVMRFLAMVFINNLNEILIRVSNNDIDEIEYIFEQRLETLDTSIRENIEKYFINFLNWSNELNYINVKDQININNIEKILFTNEKHIKNKDLYSFKVNKESQSNNQDYEFSFDEFVKEFNIKIRETDKAKFIGLFVGSLIQGVIPTFSVANILLQLCGVILEVMKRRD